MNDKLYVALRRLGVFPGPARDIARRFPDEEDTHQVLIAFRSHVRETDSIPIAVWRLRNGILLTGGAAIDNFIREPPPNYPSIQYANGAPAKGEPSTFNLQSSIFNTGGTRMKWSDFDPYLAAKHFNGKPSAVLTIDQVVVEDIYRQKDKTTVRTPVVYFRETKKGLVLSPTNQDKLEALFGDDVTACHGQRIILEVTPMRVGGRDLQVIRIAAKATKPEAQPAAPEPHAA